MSAHGEVPYENETDVEPEDVSSSATTGDHTAGRRCREVLGADRTISRASSPGIVRAGPHERNRS